MHEPCLDIQRRLLGGKELRYDTSVRILQVKKGMKGPLLRWAYMVKDTKAWTSIAVGNKLLAVGCFWNMRDEMRSSERWCYESRWELDPGCSSRTNYLSLTHSPGREWEEIGLNSRRGSFYYDFLSTYSTYTFCNMCGQHLLIRI